MKKNILKTFLILGLVTVNSNADTILSAKKTSSISKIATQKVIESFMKDPKTKQAYEEVENYISNTIKNTAKEGFYNEIHIKINAFFNQNMKFNNLSKKQKDIIKYLIKNKLRKLGYEVETGRNDIIGIDLFISWK